MAYTDLTSERFGCLTVLHVDPRKKRRYWVCKCDCGNTVSRIEGHLKKGAVACCRTCPHHGKNKHGKIDTKEYRAWVDMKQRCHNPNNPRFKDYGARGIAVCERWADSFVNFISDVGYAPNKKYSLDRVDNDGNYEPGNVKWSSPVEQQNNQRRTLWVTHNGKHYTLTELSKKTKIPRKTLYARLLRGATDIVTPPPLGPKTKKGLGNVT